MALEQKSQSIIIRPESLQKAKTNREPGRGEGNFLASAYHDNQGYYAVDKENN